MHRPSAHHFRAAPLSRHLVALVLSAMIPIALFSSVMIYRLVLSEREAGERRLIRASRELSATLDAEITSTARTAQAIAESSVLHNDNLAAFHDELVQKQRTQPSWLTVILHSAEGVPLLNSLHPFGKTRLPTSDPVSLHRILATKQPTSGLLTRGPTGNLGFAVRTPITINGNLRYVLTVVISGAAIQELVRDSLSEQGEWTRTIVDASGTVAARSRDPEKFVGSKASPDFMLGMTHVHDFGLLRSTTLDGEQVYSAVARAPHSGWYSSVAVPVAILEAPARHKMLAVAGVGLLLLIGFGTLAFAYSQYLARRINAAALAAGALARDEQPEFAPSLVTEVETLRHALVAAASLLKSRHADRDQLLGAANIARADAEAANEAKDQFLAMLGHELRNPLGAVSNGVFLLRDLVPQTPDILEIQDIIERQVGHLTCMIDDLLDASRITQGKIIMNRETLDLRVIIQNLYADFEQQFAAQSRTLTAVLPGTPVWVDADPTRLNQCFTNLLQNSLKFTSKRGRATIELELLGKEAIVTVTDNGVGIDSDLLSLLFQPFQQAPQSFDRRAGGLGLGLAVVKGLVELHGGTVKALSEGKNHGTTMRVALPASSKAATSVGHPKTPHPSKHNPVQSRRILIVEDIEDAAKSLQRILTHKGHDVRIAMTGVDGVEQVQSFHPDAVVCDLGLPDIDGNEVCRRVLLSSPDHHPQMIALSGYAQESDVRNALAAGFQYHLRKPVDFDQLAMILEQGGPAKA